eukprot:gene3506-6154_t
MGYFHPKATDIPELSQQDTCEVQMKNFGKIWKEQKKKSLLTNSFEK